MKIIVRQHTRRVGKNKRHGPIPCRINPQRPFFTDAGNSTGNKQNSNTRQFCGLCGQRVNAYGVCPVHGGKQIESYNPFAGLLVMAGAAGLTICAIVRIIQEIA